MDAILEGAGGTLSDPIDLVVQIVIAYVAYNRLPASELPILIGQTHEALCGYDRKPMSSVATGGRLTPAQIRASITRDTLTSFEDGRPYRTLKRHLTGLDLTPDTYRAKWGLPLDYPMVAASYSEKRSALARSFSLGQQRRAAAERTAETGTEANEPAVGSDASNAAD